MNIFKPTPVSGDLSVFLWFFSFRISQHYFTSLKIRPRGIHDTDAASFTAVAFTVPILLIVNLSNQKYNLSSTGWARKVNK